ncbi:secretion protein [Vibrio sp. JC009]|uniref:tetratricopeptide repeat protein n=1 Tax=Vibrio sp. JC009 TaxID=2912314 RepID=UPI0023AECFAF|nr:secretion protein [Vibrio sp. JC009]WED22303.1 secretion protein [Vibrio sp. JC009]
MYRILMLALLTLSVAACSSTPDKQMDDGAKESVYQQTGNYTELAEFYQQQLEQKETIETRLKLVHTYIQLEDSESALFYLEPVFEQDQRNCQAYDYKAQAIALTGEYIEAEEPALKALELCPDRAETENLLGIIYAGQYNYAKARKSFTAARRHFYNSAAVNNNLAVLDIAEGKYQAAMERLLPIYKRKPKDKMVKSNLILAAAKQRQYSLLYQILESDYSDAEIEGIYRTLREYQPRYRAENGHFGEDG